MYEDSWYSFVPDFQNRRGAAAQGHRRNPSLHQQPNGTNQGPDAAQDELFEEIEDDSPPAPTLTRRAKSYSDFYDVVRKQLSKDAMKKRKKKMDRGWDALNAPELPDGRHLFAEREVAPFDDALGSELLEASQREYHSYRDKLSLTERHLDTLIQDTNGALDILASLAESFRAVEDQTTSFQAQCDDLLTEQKRLEKLADDIRGDFYYYAYLEEVTRRLNAPGASRLVDGSSFAEMLSNIEACIVFMIKHPTYRDAESYQARYQSLLTKALHLLEVGFTALLDRVSTDISKQIAATASEPTRHALAYGRFEEMMLESYSLIPNVQEVVHRAYNRHGNPKSGPCADTYSNTADNIFRSYLAARDRDLKPLNQAELDAFKKEARDSQDDRLHDDREVAALMLEAASRNFVKQCFERSYNELTLFARIFSVEPQYHHLEGVGAGASSAFATLKAYRSDSVNGVNITPIATTLQSVWTAAAAAAGAEQLLGVVCHVVGWMTDEYLILDYDEDETPVALHRQELTVRVLAEHLWAFTDALFEAEITKTITKAPVVLDALKAGPPTAKAAAAKAAAKTGDSAATSSGAYPPVLRALELLKMFDQCMPKERCQRNSPVVFKIVRETIQALQRAEARIKSAKGSSAATLTDPDLFIIKNLLVLKNELLTLEIGDVRGAGIQHFPQIWDALSAAGGLIGYFSSFIPGASLFSSSSSARNSPAPGGASGSASGVGTPRVGGGTGADGQPQQQDASEQLDELLRQSIYAFTQRWAAIINDARGVGGTGGKGQAQALAGKNLGKIERDLDELLQAAFSSQPEVVAKLKEAIQINAQAAQEKNRGKGGGAASGSSSRISRV